MEILKGKEAKTYLDAMTWRGAPLSVECAALKTLGLGEVMLLEHDCSDDHKAYTCSQLRNLRQTAVLEWGSGSVSMRHGSPIAIYRKK
jgi:hypothetical protein